jgi:hypothetical protein
MRSYTYLSCTDPMKEGPSAPSTPVKQQGKSPYTTPGPSAQPVPLFSNLAIEISDDEEEEEVEAECLRGAPYPPPLAPSGGKAAYCVFHGRQTGVFRTWYELQVIISLLSSTDKLGVPPRLR